MSKNKSIFTLSVIALACATSAFAAKPVKLNKLPVTMLQSIVSLQPSPSAYAITQQSSLKEISRHVDANHTTHIRVQQTYAGYPVWGSDSVLHVPHNDHVALNNLASNTTMNGMLYQDLSSDLISMPANSFNADQANKALQSAIQNYQMKTGMKKYDTTYTKKNLMVYVDKNNKAHWAYLVNFRSGNPENNMPTEPTAIVDATTFTVYEQWDNVQTLDDVTAGGFGGNPKMGQIIYDGLQGDYSTLNMQRDAANNCFVQNEDVTVKADYFSFLGFILSRSVTFNCPTKDATHNNEYWDATEETVNGGYSPANDALYAGKVIKAMYQEWYGVPVLASATGQALPLTMHIHTKNFIDMRMENAYFTNNPSPQMYFGDGGDMFYPLTSLGVGAHEISHGFTSQHSNLTYQLQSGGLNESYSDMAAQAAEYYSTGKNSWQIGPEIVKGDGALRYMDDPTKDGVSIANVKDYTDQLNVHYTSGVFNKVFYLIGTSPGWNTRKAFDVMVKANLDYWTANTTFADAACGVVSAAKDYNYDVATISKAMTQVGIDTSSC